MQHFQSRQSLRPLCPLADFQIRALVTLRRGGLQGAGKDYRPEDRGQGIVEDEVAGLCGRGLLRTSRCLPFWKLLGVGWTVHCVRG